MPRKPRSERRAIESERNGKLVKSKDKRGGKCEKIDELEVFFFIVFLFFIFIIRLEEDICQRRELLRRN